MAIQVWDEQTQQYRGVELARYGADGTLAEALVWADGAYRRVWPTSNDFTDDFTSPTLHERWMVMGAPYDPPGLSTDLLGPQASDQFELSHTRDGNGYTSVGVLDGTFMQGVGLQWGSMGGVSLMDMGTGAVLAASPTGAPAGSVVGLRRTDGQWHIVIDNTVVDSVPDPLAGVDLSIILSGTPDARITSVVYNEL